MALDELDRIRAAGARFGGVVTDAEYGKAAAFRQGLQERAVRWAVGILPTQKVSPADVPLTPTPPKATGRPPKHPLPAVASRSVADTIAALPETAFHAITWRQGTKEPLTVDFAAQRVRVADGLPRHDGQHLPGQLAWLVCERRAGGERKDYLANHPDDTPVETLVGHIKARWVCEQAHQQMEEELGLDHFEGRSWVGLHHHTVLTMMALCFLQYLRLEGFRLGEKATTPPTDPATDPPRPGPPPTPTLPAVRRQILKALGTALCPCPNCGHPVRFDHRRLL